MSKWALPLFQLNTVFSNIITFFKKIKVNISHPVFRIRTHVLSDMNILPHPLDWGSRPSLESSWLTKRSLATDGTEVNVYVWPHIVPLASFGRQSLSHVVLQFGFPLFVNITLLKLSLLIEFILGLSMIYLLTIYLCIFIDIILVCVP